MASSVSDSVTVTASGSSTKDCARYMMSSFMVTTSKASNIVDATMQVRYTDSSGNLLTEGTVPAGTTILAKLNTMTEVKFTGMQLAISMDKNALEIQATLDEDDNEVLCTSDLSGFIPTVNYIEDTTDSDIAMLQVSFASSSAKKWTAEKAALIFTFVTEKDMKVSDLSSCLKFEAPNAEEDQTCYGVTKCRSRFAHKTKSVDDVYNVTFLVGASLIATVDGAIYDIN